MVVDHWCVNTKITLGSLPELKLVNHHTVDNIPTNACHLFFPEFPSLKIGSTE